MNGINEIMEEFVINKISVKVFDDYVRLHRHYRDGIGTCLDFKDIDELKKFFDIDELDELCDELLKDYAHFDP